MTWCSSEPPKQAGRSGAALCSPCAVGENDRKMAAKCSGARGRDSGRRNAARVRPRNVTPRGSSPSGTPVAERRRPRVARRGFGCAGESWWRVASTGRRVRCARSTARRLAAWNLAGRHAGETLLRAHEGAGGFPWQLPRRPTSTVVVRRSPCAAGVLGVHRLRQVQRGRGAARAAAVAGNDGFHALRFAFDAGLRGGCEDDC